MQIEPYAPPGLPVPVQPQPLALNYYAVPAVDRDEISLSQLLSIARRRIWVIAGVTAAVTGVIWGWTLTRSPVYQSGFQVLVEPITSLGRPREQEVVLFGNRSAFDYATQIQVLRSPELLSKTVDALQAKYPDMSYGEMASRLSISQITDAEGRTTKILAITYKDGDPQKVKDVLDQLSKDYLDYSVDLRKESLQQGVKFVEDRLPELQERVDTLQAQLQRFRQRYSIVDPEFRGEQVSEQIDLIEKQRQDADAQLAQSQSLLSALQQQLRTAAPEQAIAASALSESPRYQKILNELQEIEAQIAAESARFQPNSPNIQVLLDKRRNLLPLLNQEAERILGRSIASQSDGNLTSISLDLSKQLVNTANQVEVLQVRSQTLAETEARLRREFSLVPALARQYTDIQRELTVATESLNRFLATREDLQIEAAQRSVPWQLLVPPVLPNFPISPNVKRNLVLGLFAGLLLGGTAALLAENLDNVYHTASDLKESIRLPLLGVIPYQKTLVTLPAASAPLTLSPAEAPQELTRDDQLETPELETKRLEQEARTHLEGYHASPFTDAFRTLYTNIRFLGTDESIKSLVIGSAVPADGKSTVAVHLAQAAAAMGQRVLLVDADLRRPQIHTLVGLQNLRGLSHLISTEADPADAIQISAIDSNLAILTAGQIPPDPTKLLSSKKMQSLVEQFQQDYDLVIYDTPPVLGLADSSILASQTAGLVLVVGIDRTDRNSLTQALDSVKTASVPILGLVANGVKEDLVKSTYQAYYSQYYQKAEATADS